MGCKKSVRSGLFRRARFAERKKSIAFIISYCTENQVALAKALADAIIALTAVPAEGVPLRRTSTDPCEKWSIEIYF